MPASNPRRGERGKGELLAALASAEMSAGTRDGLAGVGLLDVLEAQAENDLRADESAKAAPQAENRRKNREDFMTLPELEKEMEQELERLVEVEGR